VLSANRVFLTTDEKNLASRRLAERAGFELEGTLRLDRRDLEGRLRLNLVKSTKPLSLYVKLDRCLGQLISSFRIYLIDRPETPNFRSLHSMPQGG
jgi:hypothetical protein